MEVEDVSNIPRWMDMLAKQKAALESAHNRKGERPKDRYSRDQLISRFMAHYSRKATLTAQNNQHLIHSSFVPPPYLPSNMSVNDLKEMSVRDLRLETHHRGKYLLLKAVTPPNVMTAAMMIMEDGLKEGVILQLYQQETLDERVVRDAFQINNVCIIKEPYFKIMADGCYGVRIDHVSDIAWISTEDQRVPLSWHPEIIEIREATSLKEEGNVALRAGKMWEATGLYTRAIALSTDDAESQLIKLNRSLAHLRLGCFDKSITDAGRLTQDVQKSEKGYYRAARSFYELRRFGECHETLRDLLSQYPDCEAAKKEIFRSERRLQEQEYGDYDFRIMYEAARETPPCLDQATHVGPVKIQASEGCGRGLFTTRAVAAGELLLCEKAFTHCFAAQEANEDSSKVKSRTTMLMHTHSNRAVMGAQADLITATVQKLYRNPSLLPAFVSLHHGDYIPVKEAEVDELPIIDTFLITEIIRLNAFGCPRTSLHSTFTETASKAESKAHHTTGMFITASYINHSCYSNVRRSFIGDMQIVRATRDIPADAEIFFWYAAPESDNSYEKTQGELSNWGFKCTCVMCKENQKTKKSILNKRAALVKDFITALTGSQGPQSAKAERIVLAIEKTYTAPASKIPRLALREPYLHLTRLYSVVGPPSSVISAGLNFLRALGFVILERKDSGSTTTSDFELQQWGLMDDSCAEIWVHLWVAYAHLAPQLCSKAEGMARTCYKICIGEDETFGEKYGEVAKGAISGGKNLTEEIERLKL